MSTKLSLATCCLAASLLTACAPNDEWLQRRTTYVVPGDISPHQVKVSDARHRIVSITWVASTPSGSYNCRIGLEDRRVSCVEKK